VAGRKSCGRRSDKRRPRGEIRGEWQMFFVDVIVGREGRPCNHAIVMEQ